jgi:hypothetical protein
MVRMGLDMEAVNKPSNVLFSRVDGSFVHTFHGADEKLDRFTTAGLITSTFFPLSFFSPLDLVCVQVQFYYAILFAHFPSSSSSCPFSNICGVLVGACRLTDRRTICYSLARTVMCWAMKMVCMRACTDGVILLIRSVVLDVVWIRLKDSTFFKLYYYIDC